MHRTFNLNNDVPPGHISYCWDDTVKYSCGNQTMNNFIMDDFTRND